MESHRRKLFMEKRDDSPSPDITYDYITPDYKNPNFHDNPRRTSSLDSLDSGIGSTGSFHHSTITTASLTQDSKTKTKINPFSSSQGISLRKHPKHESLEATFRMDEELEDREKERRDIDAALERFKDVKSGYFYSKDAPTKGISLWKHPKHESFKMEIELKDREKEQRDEDADQDQGSSLAMENHIPDCEDPPKPIPPRIKIKTIRSPRLSKDVDLSHGLVKARKDYFGAKTQVKQKRTTLSGKKMDFISHFMPYKQDRDPVKKITTYSFDRPDADDYNFNDISLLDENNSASPPILGYLKEARETKEPRKQTLLGKYKVKDTATDKEEDHLAFEPRVGLLPNYLDFAFEPLVPPLPDYLDFAFEPLVPPLPVFPLMNKTKEDNDFLVLIDIDYLPRYKYHRSLLEWFLKGLPYDPAFPKCNFEDCSVIVGGNLDDEKKKELFCGADNLAFQNLQKDTTLKTSVLIVYFYTDDGASMHQEIKTLRRHHKFEKGTLLLVMTTRDLDANELKMTIHDLKLAMLGIKRVSFAIETRSEIIRKITCILERRLSTFLKNTKTKLLKYCSTMPNVRQSLLEVNAILRKLKQAACYPKPLEDDKTGEKSDDQEIDEILQRFREKILYQGYDDDKLYVITNDQNVKESLEAWFLESGIENLQLVITFEEKLSTTELSKTGEPLNGAKFVYVQNSVGDFKEDKCYATIGCLMQASNNMMVAVTCQHALERKENFFTLINNSVVKLGQELPQVNKQMARLYDDIALIVIDGETRNDIDKYCERLLIDSFGIPSPAEIASESLKKGDIVHKWGATTGLTTGIVKEVKHQAIGRFTSESTVIFITGRDSEPFANEGDSGSLIFKRSESPEQNLLYIYGMVQSRLKVPFANAPIICFPFKESYDSLKNNLPDIQTLQFCKF